MFLRCDENAGKNKRSTRPFFFRRLQRGRSTRPFFVRRLQRGRSTRPFFFVDFSANARRDRFFPSTSAPTVDATRLLRAHGVETHSSMLPRGREPARPRRGAPTSAAADWQSPRQSENTAADRQARLHAEKRRGIPLSAMPFGRSLEFTRRTPTGSATSEKHKEPSAFLEFPNSSLHMVNTTTVDRRSSNMLRKKLLWPKCYRNK